MSNKPMKNFARGLFPFLFVCLFLLCSVLVGVTAAKLATERAKADLSNDSGTTSTGDADKPGVDVVDKVDKIEENGVTFLSHTEFGATLTDCGNDIYSLQLSDGKTYCVTLTSGDFVYNNRVSYSSTLPILRDGKLYLPYQSRDVLDDALQTATRENAFPLPENLDSVSYLKALQEEHEFIADLTEFVSYFDHDDDAHYLVLANATHSLGVDYTPKSLTYVERARYSDANYKARLELRAAQALDGFLRETYAHGYNDITVTSGYRSYYDQEFRFNTKVNSLRSQYATLEEAQAAAATVIQWPGKSEHQTGLACDMHNLDAASTAFANTDAAKWMHENAHYFGFILRYPEDKTDVTGISYEPWHFRYVGKYHATRMYLLQITLEEYVAFLQNAGVIV